MKVVDKEEGATVSDELETIQYLTFSMADELIAVDGARVLEILELADLANETPLPDFMRGVVSLRGCPVPVIDLRLSFAMGEPVQTVGSFNVVVELAKDGENVVLQASNDEGRQVIENRFQVEAAPYWLRCRFSKKDLNLLSRILLHAAASPETLSAEGIDRRAYEDSGPDRNRRGSQCGITDDPQPLHPVQPQRDAHDLS
jgi:hypothetical protein